MIWRLVSDPLHLAFPRGEARSPRFFFLAVSTLSSPASGKKKKNSDRWMTPSRELGNVHDLIEPICKCSLARCSRLAAGRTLTSSAFLCVQARPAVLEGSTQTATVSPTSFSLKATRRPPKKHHLLTSSRSVASLLPDQTR